MTLEELDRELVSSEERLLASLQELKNAKVEYRKARITSISNKLLAPFRRFKINMAIAKYDAMMEKLEKQRQKEIERAEKLQEKEAKKERKQAKADFKAAIREKQKEDIINFVNDKKDVVANYIDDRKPDISERVSEVKEFGYSVVSTSASYMGSFKNSLVDKVKANTLIDLTIRNAIDNLKFKYATNKYNKAVERQEEAKERIRLEELNNAMKLSKEMEEDRKNRDVPFSNIGEKIQKARKQSSYMGRATNKAIVYIRENYDNVSSKINNKILETKINVNLTTYIVIGKVTKAGSGMITAFNNKISDVKENISDKVDTFKTNMDIRKAESLQRKEEKEIRNKRKEDMMVALREDDERKREIRRIQLENLKQATEVINNDIFDNSMLQNENLKTL